MTRPTSVRRLEAMVIGLAIVFAAIAAVPFAASLQPGGAADPGYLDVDVARIEPGSYTERGPRKSGHGDKWSSALMGA